MVTQIVFTIDSKVKAKAMKRARDAGIPFASYLRQATEDFADGKMGFALIEEIPNMATRRAMKELENISTRATLKRYSSSDALMKSLARNAS